MQPLLAWLGSAHPVSTSAFAGAAVSFLTTYAEAGSVAAAAGAVGTGLAIPVLAALVATGCARHILNRTDRQRAAQLAEHVESIEITVGDHAALLRSIAERTGALAVPAGDGGAIAPVEAADLDSACLAISGQDPPRISSPLAEEFEFLLKEANLATAEQAEQLQKTLDDQGFNWTVYFETLVHLNRLSLEELKALHADLSAFRAEFRRYVVQSLEAEGGAGPPTTNFHHIGIDRDEKFVAVEDGRERNLRDLHAALNDGHASITHSLSGAGGVGKTALAVEYAYRHAIHGPDYDACWWLNASAETIEPRAFELAELLGAKLAPDAEPAMVRLAIRKALSDGRHHLLILDNLEDAAQAETFMPPSPSRLLITTRVKQAPGTVIDIDVLAEEESLRLLRAARSQFEDGSFDADLRAIAEHLDHHALALRYTAAYLAAYGDQSPHEVLEALQTADVGDEAHLFEDVEPSEVDRQYGRSVAESLTLHFSRFGTDALEMRLLAFAAFCHPDAIPVELFVELTGAEERAVRKALKALADLHIVEYEETIGLHRLTQSAMRARMMADEKRDRLNVVCEHLEPRFADWDDHTKWAVMDRWIGHGLAVVEQTERHCRTARAARLANMVGAFLERRARYAEAIMAHQLAYHIGKANPDEVGPDLAVYANNLGCVLQGTGNLESALLLYREAERIDRAAFGDEHPSVAVRVANIGRVLYDKGDLEGALECFREAERIDRAAFGDDHPEVATNVNNIGSVLLDQGDLDGALALYREAERIHRAIFGDDHPEVATNVNNIGEVLRVKGDLDGALECYREAERIDRTAFGDDHPNVAIRVNNIGLALKGKRDLDGALACYREAERIDRAAFGDEHPNVATSLNNIGGILLRRGDREGARRMSGEALGIGVRMLGPRSLETLQWARNYAVVGGDPIALAREAAGDEAAEALRQALEEE
jgi:tetratricopeptide (TPR) repeat protein/DNA-binding transcriptional ArsR family regulator